MAWQKKSGEKPKTQAEIRDEINAKIIACMESGKLPFWNRPWRGGDIRSTPHNVVSQKSYHGINVFLCEMSAMASGYPTNQWASFNQWKQLGGGVKRGEKATSIVLWKFFQPENQKPEYDSRGKLKPPKTIPFLRYWSVFNIAQVNPQDGKRILALLPKPEDQVKDKPFGKDFDVAKAIVAACKEDGLVLVHRGDRAFWTEGTQNVTMPSRSQFKSDSDYFQTLFHEIGHFSEPRCKWDRQTHGYAMGELRAELCSCYLSQAAHLPAGESLDALQNHAAYLKSWLERMKSDNHWIFSACKFADEAANCILKIAGMEEPNGEETEQAA